MILKPVVLQETPKGNLVRKFNHLQVPWKPKYCQSDGVTPAPAIMTPEHKYIEPKSNLKYDSVTTILNNTKSVESMRNLQAWRAKLGSAVADYIFCQSAIIGTQAHQLNEDYLNGVIEEKEDYQLLSYAHHENFKPYLQKIDNIHGTEIILHSDSLELAGTTDCIAEYNGTLSIIDYKTKRSQQRAEWLGDYFLQTAAYSIMYEELTGITVGQSVILASSERNTMQSFVTDITPSRKREFLQRLREHNEKKQEQKLAGDFGEKHHGAENYSQRRSNTLGAKKPTSTPVQKRLAAPSGIAVFG